MMIPHFFRLLELWRISAHYRLDLMLSELKKTSDLPAPAIKQLEKLSFFISLHPAAWISSQKNNPQKLKLALEEMGALAIKMGQLLSTRRDLIPPEILQQLILLQDQVKPFDTKVAKQRIEHAFGQTIEQLFAEFDDEPLAAASIAQVHTATLHDGKQVVVKITRPNIREQILQDFEILQWLGQRLELMFDAARAIHIGEIIQEYRTVILNELNLNFEAENTRRMRSYFLHSNMMYVPEVYMESTDVMVAERIFGVPISDTATLDSLNISRQDLAEKGLKVFFTQVFRDNFFHADMHPGNIFIDTQNPYQPRYIALDCAIMGELSKQDQMTVARLLLAVMNSDFDGLIDVLSQADWIPLDTNQQALATEMRRTVAPMIAKPMNELDFAGILMQILDIARRFQLEIPPQLMLLLKTLIHIEGLGTDLYPELDIWKLTKPIIEDWLKQQLNPISQIKQFGRKIPNFLLNHNTSNGQSESHLQQRQQLAWQEKQLKELQQLRMQMYQQNQRNWLYGTLFLLCLAIGIVSPLALTIPAFIIAFLIILFRLMK